MQQIFKINPEFLNPRKLFKVFLSSVKNRQFVKILIKRSKSEHEKENNRTNAIRCLDKAK